MIGDISVNAWLVSGGQRGWLVKESDTREKAVILTWTQ